MHPGLWLAFGDLNGVDFWRNKGRIEHVRFVHEPETDADRVSFAVEDRYLSPTGEEVCRGVSEFCVVAGELLEPAVPGTVILFATTLHSDRAPLVFGPQHEMGLGIRVATPLVVKNGSGTISVSHGGRNEAGTWGRVGTWWDYSGTVDGKRAGILLAAAQDNSRAVWAHARDYGFLALNPTGPRAGPRRRTVGAVHGREGRCPAAQVRRLAARAAGGRRLVAGDGRAEPLPPRSRPGRLASQA